MRVEVRPKFVAVYPASNNIEDVNGILVGVAELYSDEPVKEITVGRITGGPCRYRPFVENARQILVGGDLLDLRIGTVRVAEKPGVTITSGGKKVAVLFPWLPSAAMSVEIYEKGERGPARDFVNLYFNWLQNGLGREPAGARPYDCKCFPWQCPEGYTPVTGGAPGAETGGEKQQAGPVSPGARPTTTTTTTGAQPVSGAPRAGWRQPREIVGGAPRATQTTTTTTTAPTPTQTQAATTTTTGVQVPVGGEPAGWRPPRPIGGGLPETTQVSPPERTATTTTTTAPTPTTTFTVPKRAPSPQPQPPSEIMFEAGKRYRYLIVFGTRFTRSSPRDRATAIVYALRKWLGGYKESMGSPPHDCGVTDTLTVFTVADVIPRPLPGAEAYYDGENLYVEVWVRGQKGVFAEGPAKYKPYIGRGGYVFAGYVGNVMASPQAMVTLDLEVSGQCGRARASLRELLGKPGVRVSRKRGGDRVVLAVPAGVLSQMLPCRPEKATVSMRVHVFIDGRYSGEIRGGSTTVPVGQRQPARGEKEAGAGKGAGAGGVVTVPEKPVRVTRVSRKTMLEERFKTLHVEERLRVCVEPRWLRSYARGAARPSSWLVNIYFINTRNGRRMFENLWVPRELLEKGGCVERTVTGGLGLECGQNRIRVLAEHVPGGGPSTAYREIVDEFTVTLRCRPGAGAGTGVGAGGRGEERGRGAGAPLSVRVRAARILSEAEEAMRLADRLSRSPRLSPEQRAAAAALRNQLARVVRDISEMMTGRRPFRDLDTYEAVVRMARMRLNELSRAAGGAPLPGPRASPEELRRLLERITSVRAKLLRAREALGPGSASREYVERTLAWLDTVEKRVRDALAGRTSMTSEEARGLLESLGTVDEVLDMILPSLGAGGGPAATATVTPTTTATPATTATPTTTTTATAPPPPQAPQQPAGPVATATPTATETAPPAWGAPVQAPGAPAAPPPGYTYARERARELVSRYGVWVALGLVLVLIVYLLASRGA